MARVPKSLTTYCPRCRSHGEFTVSIYSHGKRRTLAEGQRRYLRKLKGYGSSRKPKQKRFAKVTKKVALKLKCKRCGYVMLRSIGRLKKVEVV